MPCHDPLSRRDATGSCRAGRAGVRQCLGWAGRQPGLRGLALAWLACAGSAAFAQHTPSPLPGPQLRLALSPVASMVYEPRRVPAASPLADNNLDGAAPSLGLEFKSPAKRDGPRALLRVQLSADSALQFRPRRGGLAVSYRAEF